MTGLDIKGWVYLINTSLLFVYDTKLHLMVSLRSWSLRNVDYLFIASTFRSTLNRSGSTWLGPIYRSDRSV